MEDASVAQARALLTSLYECVTETSQSIAKAEHLIRRTPKHSTTHRHHRLRAADLRKELYEAHRLIDGLHHRYPGTRNTPWPTLRPEAVGTVLGKFGTRTPLNK